MLKKERSGGPDGITVQQVHGSYRVQLNRDFRLDDLAALTPYFSALGVSHIYCSPITTARAGSMHGYDVIDPVRLNPELGDQHQLLTTVQKLRENGLRSICDIVPNHMAATSANPYFRAVLEHGRHSPYFRWFDILTGTDQKIIIPALGSHLRDVVARGEVHLAWHDDGFEFVYYDDRFPADPASVADIFTARAEALPSDSIVWRKLHPILDRLAALPYSRETVEVSEARIGAAAAAYNELAALMADSPESHRWLDEQVAAVNADPQALLGLLESQVYRLTFWHRANRKINYRRFFDINELIGIRLHDPEVFRYTHRLVFELVQQALLDAIRVDHIDGLLDPSRYLHMLRGELERHSNGRDIPLFVEKILTGEEQLPQEWGVTGTTGYEFIASAENLFIDEEGWNAMEAAYDHLQESNKRFHDWALWGKRRALLALLGADMNRIVARIAVFLGKRGEKTYASYTALIRAFVEVIAALPVYRTYINGERPAGSSQDQYFLRHALEEARKNGKASSSAIDSLARLFIPLDKEPAEEDERLRIVLRFQQISGAATAKGVEDTAFYNYVPLVSRNEVGGAPEAPLTNWLERFHADNEQRAKRYPRAMLAVSTHDTKRSADVRARLNVLSEIPQIWFDQVREWQKLHKPFRQGNYPDAVTEYSFYQALVGIWPFPGTEFSLPQLEERLQAYMLKAAREAKRMTSWTQPNETFESALRSFVSAVLQQGEQTEFFPRVRLLLELIGVPGVWNSLSRTALQFTVPGFPDLYQGDELWNFSLVDPDNRRPVDFVLRRELLDQIRRRFVADGESRAQLIKELWVKPYDGRIKLFLINRLLDVRARMPHLFSSQSYLPMLAEGRLRKHVVAYARQHEEQFLLVIVPRLLMQLLARGHFAPVGEDVWRDTVIILPEQIQHVTHLECGITGKKLNLRHEHGRVRVAELLSFPVGVFLGY